MVVVIGETGGLTHSVKTANGVNALTLVQMTFRRKSLKYGPPKAISPSGSATKFGIAVSGELTQ